MKKVDSLLYKLEKKQNNRIGKVYIALTKKELQEIQSKKLYKNDVLIDGSCLDEVESL